MAPLPFTGSLDLPFVGLAAAGFAGLSTAFFASAAGFVSGGADCASLVCGVEDCVWSSAKAPGRTRTSASNAAARNAETGRVGFVSGRLQS